MEQESVKKKKKGGKNTFILAGMGLIIVAVILIVVFLLNGSMTIDNAPGDATVTKSLSCESTQVPYPMIGHDDAEKRFLKINVIFKDQKVDKISLIYKMFYDDADKINASKSLNHADLNINFGSDSLSADSFGAVYSSLKDAMQISLHAEARDVNEVSAKYFLLDDAARLYDRDKLAKLYNSKGFDCTTNN